MVTALNDTIVNWRNKTNWSYTNETALHSGTGILQWRGTYDASVEDFIKWMHTPPTEDPLQERTFTYADGYDGVTGTAKVPFQPGFAFDSGYGADMAEIYPATGAAYLGANLIGISKTSRNATLAYDTMIEAFARNAAFHMNSPPKGPTNTGGVSGYASVKYNPQYAFTGKGFYDPLIDHAMFVGSPVPQSAAYGSIAKANPMQVAFNDILYKVHLYRNLRA
ncbi:hypothetical protein HDV00_006703 [Rhizophlyctis rosea]|nr:hypothetical protein HDV00_006703 [Rhizophlyctis rosea]